MDRLLHSSKFWTLALDTIVSLITLVVTQFVAPEAAEFALKVVALLQVPVAFVITGIFVEDYAAKRAGYGPRPPDEE